MWMQQKTVVDELMAMDACLMGIGGHCKINDRFFHCETPEYVRSLPEVNIAHFELWAILVAVRTWGRYITGHRFVMGCDNEAVMTIVNTGRSRDRLLQTLLRQLIMEVARCQSEIVTRFVPGYKNVVPDLLSRMCLGGKYVQQFEERRRSHWQQDKITQMMFGLDGEL